MNDRVFDTDRLVPVYFRQALPVVLNMVVTLIYNLADTWFVARTGNALLVAGVSLCAPVFTMLMAFGNIYGQGGSSLISRLLGADDRPSVRRVSSFSFWLAIATGVVLAVPMLIFRSPMLRVLGSSPDTLKYAGEYYTWLAIGAPLIILSFIHSNLLRCEGMATQSMFCTVSGSVLNIILDPIFISVLGLGAAGAAIATVLGYTLSDILCLLIVLKKSRSLSVKTSDCRLKNGELGQILAVGITAAVTNLATSVCVVTINQFLSSYGDEKIAAMGIVSKISMIVQLILVGFSFGGVPVFGYLYGAGMRDKLRSLLQFVMTFLCGLALAMTLVIIAASSPLMRFFIDDAGIISDGTVMLRWQISCSAFGGVVLLLTCLFQATGKALPALILSLSRQGLLFLAVLWLATTLLGYTGFLAAQPAADVLSAALALFLYFRQFGREGRAVSG